MSSNFKSDEKGWGAAARLKTKTILKTGEIYSGGGHPGKGFQ